MSSRNGTTSKGGAGKSKTAARDSAAGRFNGNSTKKSGGGPRVRRDADAGSAADRKMMRAWETISENRGAARRK